MAYLWKLPCLYICENNQYAMGTTVERHSAGGNNFHSKLTWCPGIKFDGFNIYEVREGIKWAKNYAINNGPIAINI